MFPAPMTPIRMGISPSIDATLAVIRHEMRGSATGNLPAARSALTNRIDRSPLRLPAESNARLLDVFPNLHVAIPRRGARDPFLNQAPRCRGYLIHGVVEQLLVRLRRLVRPAHLPNELQSRGAYLPRCRRRREIREGPYVAAHADQTTSSTNRRPRPVGCIAGASMRRFFSSFVTSVNFSSRVYAPDLC